MTRRYARLAVLIAAPILAAASPLLPIAATPAMADNARSERDAAAEQFVLTEANRALSILGDKSKTVDAKKKAFRAFVDDVADVPAITGYVLGKYRRSLTEAQYAEFSTVFREYASNVYESRLGTYKGETLRVTASIVRRPGDVIVTSEVVGGQTKQPLKVLWRVLKRPDGNWRAVDVQVEGVWLAITQQQDFVSTLDTAHGHINVLINQLKNGPKKDPARGR